MTDLPATIAVLREMLEAKPYAPARQRKALRDAIEALEEAERVIEPLVREEVEWIEMGDARPLYPGCHITVLDTRNAVDWMRKWSAK